MEQNINLLSSFPSKVKLILSAERNALALAALIMLLIMIYWFESETTIRNQNKLTNLQTTKQNALFEAINLKQQIQNFNVQFGGGGVPQLPPNAIFSYYLEKLAEKTPEGISLESFSFSVPKNTTTLSGKTYSTQLLSNYLDILNESHALGNQKLTTLKLQKNEDNTLNFTLSN